MKNLFFCGLLAFFCSCNSNVTVKPTGVKIEGVIMQSYTIDSCEYIGYVKNTNQDFLTHKGNCKFCKARQKK